jgi:hypothetical protein
MDYVYFMTKQAKNYKTCNLLQACWLHNLSTITNHDQHAPEYKYFLYSLYYAAMLSAFVYQFASWQEAEKMHHISFVKQSIKLTLRHDVRMVNTSVSIVV